MPRKLKATKTPNSTARIDGNAIELHPATDDWMRGDRFAKILGVLPNGDLMVKLDKSCKLRRVQIANVYKVFTR
jgi:hypothetical protein